MIKKYDIEYFKILATNNGGKCLSEKYEGSDHKLKIRCKDGHVWEARPFNLINRKSWCPYCCGRGKDNIETFKKIAIEKNGECLSTEYINCRTKLKFKCNDGHVWETLPRTIKYSKSWCPICSGHIKLDINEAQEIAKHNGGKCISPIYTNANTNLLWECKHGHIWLANINRIKNSNDWCPICSKNKKLTIEEMQKIAIERNGKCISEKYINSNTKLLWECKFGHQWMAKPRQIKNLNRWCPICNESLGERIIDGYLKRNNVLFEREKKFKNCKGKRFDFYLPEYNILIEYDGKQHFMPVNFYGCSNEKAEKTYLYSKHSDEIKNKYCLDNNIRLIRIPYTIKNIEDYLNNELQNILNVRQ